MQRVRDSKLTYAWVQAPRGSTTQEAPPCFTMSPHGHEHHENRRRPRPYPQGSTTQRAPSPRATAPSSAAPTTTTTTKAAGSSARPSASQLPLDLCGMQNVGGRIHGMAQGNRRCSVGTCAWQAHSRPRRTERVKHLNPLPGMRSRPTHKQPLHSIFAATIQAK